MLPGVAGVRVRPRELERPGQRLQPGARENGIFIELRPNAGGSAQVVFVDDLDALAAGISERGIEPDQWLAFGEGTREAVYRDPDGNELRFGGLPATPPP